MRLRRTESVSATPPYVMSAPAPLPVRLLLHLETCVRFIAAIGTGATVAAVDPSMPLTDFVCTTLSVDEQEWEAATTPTINDLVGGRGL